MTDVSLSAMRELQRLVVRLNSEPSLAMILQYVVDGVVEGLGFEVAVVNLVHEDDTVEVVTVAGPPDVSAALLGNRSDVATWEAEIGRSEAWGALCYLASTEPDAEGLPSWVPEAATSEEPDAWDPLDALFAPLCSATGALVGILSVDLPANGRHPDEVQRALLEMYATQAGIAIDNARLVARVRESEESFRLAFENAPFGMSIVDLRVPTLGRYLRVNEAMCRMLGYSRRDLLELTATDITHADDLDRDQLAIAHALNKGFNRYETEKRYLRHDGDPVWVSLRTSVVRDADGVALYGISQFEDISDRRAEHQELTRRARIDPLTGLLNRSSLNERLRSAIGNARRSKRSGCVLFCDLDAFKPINDTYGHAVGDQVLAIVARRLEAQTRTGDTLARFGGDEFVLVADDLGDEAVDELVARLRASVAAPIHVRADTIYLEVTVGRAQVKGEDDESPEALISCADIDMYHQKPHAGRRRHQATGEGKPGEEPT